jgi:hypothetical protein
MPTPSGSLLVEEQSLGWSLFAFNLGLEIGQIVVVLAALILGELVLQIYTAPTAELGGDCLIHRDTGGHEYGDRQSTKHLNLDTHEISDRSIGIYSFVRDRNGAAG